jgi:hypothetical protein
MVRRVLPVTVESKSAVAMETNAAAVGDQAFLRVGASAE